LKITANDKQNISTYQLYRWQNNETVNEQ